MAKTTRSVAGRFGRFGSFGEFIEAYRLTRQREREVLLGRLSPDDALVAMQQRDVVEVNAHGGKPMSVLHVTHHPLGFTCLPTRCFS